MTKIKLEKRFRSSQGDIAHDSFGDGPDVILVHGTPVNSVIWSELVHALKHKFRFHLLDLPGYGQSAMFDGQDVRLRSFARILAEFVQHRQLEDYILIGHDFGGGTVLGAHLIEKLSPKAIAVCDGVTLSPWGTPFSRHVRENEKVFAAVPPYIHEATLRAHLETAVNHPMKPDMQEALLAPWLGTEGQAAYYRQVAQYDYDFTTELERLYPEITIPTLIMWGQQDQWLPLANGEKLHELIPHSSFEILPDAGHFAMLDTPQLFRNRLEDWLDSITG
ncbi:alpha/beta fold hydrolase [Kiloniella sp. b19]|uniref:alpha/beta fold hydrolase n=1 Tax=Kiloniella sp. GXU_MW_B19 TaxID=3141326 RepID=UPI0031D88BA7